MSNEERVQWTLGVIAKLKNAGIGDSKKLDDMKHLLENGKTINTQQIIYLREKFDELNKNQESVSDDSSPTYTEEPDKNQSESKRKIKSYRPALIITLAGVILTIVSFFGAAASYYASDFVVLLLLFFIGIIIMIVGGIVAGITRLQRKKQHQSKIPFGVYDPARSGVSMQSQRQSLSESKNIPQSPIKENDAVQVLKMRLAKGEITKEEFDKIKDDLKD